MHKFIAIGDIHADWDGLWAALRAAYAADAQGQPSLPVRAGAYQVVLIGDLVHPKTEADYARLAGVSAFDVRNPEHLALAAGAQVRQLERLKAYHEAAPHSVHIILGNHDDAVLNTQYVLGTGAGLAHTEFDPGHGGLPLPEHLRAWFGTFLRELRVGNLHFAHVGPLPMMAYYDDLFYADHTHKRWWRETPDYVEMAGLSYGVYGHTQMEEGVLLHEGGRFAMIDALHKREYLELMIEASEPEPVVNLRVAPF